jgi:hypothetical protein
VPVYPDKKLLFLHVPKCAGGTIDAALVDKRSSEVNSIIERIINFYLRRTDQRSKNLFGLGLFSFSLQHLTLDQIIDLNLMTPKQLRSFTIFTVVRHPEDRFMSAFASHSRSDAYTSINQFVEFIEGEYHTLLDFDLKSHLRPMNEFIRSPYRCDVNVFKVEKLSELSKFLAARNINVSKLEKKSHQRAAIADSKMKLNKMSRLFINEFYKADFSTFSYEKRV